MPNTNYIDEATAQTLWCSFTQISTPQTAFDSTSGDYTTTLIAASDPTVPAVTRPNCIASQCMAWRWNEAGDLGFCGRTIIPIV
jgi:hypothetical protein